MHVDGTAPAPVSTSFALFADSGDLPPKRKRRRGQEQARVTLPEGIADRWKHLVAVGFLFFFEAITHNSHLSLTCRMDNSSWQTLKFASVLRTPPLGLALTGVGSQMDHTTLIFGITFW